METQEKPINEKESLLIIEQMITSVKKDIKDDGFYFLLWGWLVFIAAIIHYVLLAINFKHHYIAWPVLMPLGGIIHLFYAIRQEKKVKVKTYVDDFLSYLWGAFLISLLILLGFMPYISYEKAYPLIIMLYGIGTFVTGGALRFPPLIIGGIVCWIITIGAFFVKFDFQLLLLAMAILISYIIPGHILKAKYKNGNL